MRLAQRWRAWREWRRLAPEFRAVDRSPEQVEVVGAGRRSGKTFSMARIAARRAVKGDTVVMLAWLGLSWQEARELSEVTRRIGGFSETATTWTHESGGSIRMARVYHDSARQPTADPDLLAVIEPALMPDVGHIAAQALTRGAQVMFMGTPPDDPDHWWNAWAGLHRTWSIPMEANPAMPEDELLAARRDEIRGAEWPSMFDGTWTQQHVST